MEAALHPPPQIVVGDDDTEPADADVAGAGRRRGQDRVEGDDDRSLTGREGLVLVDEQLALFVVDGPREGGAPQVFGRVAGWLVGVDQRSNSLRAALISRPSPERSE